jgi:hypothetical protein
MVLMDRLAKEFESVYITGWVEPETSQREEAASWVHAWI